MILHPIILGDIDTQTQKKTAILIQNCSLFFIRYGVMVYHHATCLRAYHQKELFICGIVLEYNRESEERIHKGFALAQAQLTDLFI